MSLIIIFFTVSFITAKVYMLCSTQCTVQYDTATFLRTVSTFNGLYKTPYEKLLLLLLLLLVVPDTVLFDLFFL